MGQSNINQFSLQQLAKIAKRDNNTKRSYLLVNPLQGKHIPVSPTKVMELFAALCRQMQDTFANETLLIIGFAETATAIGAALATISPNVLCYVHTTREQVAGCEDYLYFSEEHSHATDQKLAISQLMPYIQQADRIVFAEDEVTTGNTISNLIRELKLHYPNHDLKFGITSILNGMPENTLNEFREKDIPCAYVCRVTNRNFDEVLSSYDYPQEAIHKYDLSTSFDEFWDITGRKDTRSGVIPSDYQNACKELAYTIAQRLADINQSVAGITQSLADTNQSLSDTPQECTRLLVLGSEESMFPALCLAEYLEQTQQYSEVRFHATTRSPILPSKDSEYPLQDRYELVSIAPTEHTIFVYNLSDYDVAIVIHEQQAPSEKGLFSLATTLKKCGVGHTICCNWKEGDIQ